MANAWLIDTSVLIDHLRGEPRATELLLGAAREGRELLSSVLVRTEVLAGMRPPEEAATRRLLAQLRWIEVTEAIADRAGALAQKHLRSHPGIDLVDYVLAATAELESAELKTRNAKHFPMLPHLRPAY